MTRQEWFKNQTKEVQQKFIDNCNNNNPLSPSGESFFEVWVNSKNPMTPGIRGAFILESTPEGFGFWAEINNEFLENVENQKKQKGRSKNENSKKE